MKQSTAIEPSSVQPYREARRVQQSLLSGLEKRVLVFMARRMPAWVTADHLTALGFAAMIAAGACYALSAAWRPALLLVNLCLAVNWFGDSMDGTLARVRNKLRPRYGYYVDHIIDALSAVFLFAGMALSGLASPWVACAMLVCYHLLAIQSYLAAHSLGVFAISWWKFSPTEMRLLLAAGNAVVFFKPLATVFGRQYLFFDIGGAIAVACMLAVLAASVLISTVTLYRQEPL